MISGPVRVFPDGPVTQKKKGLRTEEINITRHQRESRLGHRAELQTGQETEMAATCAERVVEQEEELRIRLWAWIYCISICVDVEGVCFLRKRRDSL